MYKFKHSILAVILLTFACNGPREDKTTEATQIQKKTVIKENTKTPKGPKIGPHGLVDVPDPEEGNPALTLEDHLAAPMPTSSTFSRSKLAKMAHKAGSRVNWRYNFEEALIDSRMSKRPIIFSVGPKFEKITYDEGKAARTEQRRFNVLGSPSYRPRDYDTHLRMTLFHYKSCVDLINRKFIPLRMSLTREHRKIAEKYKLQRFDLIEPGFAMISPFDKPSGFNIHVVDRIATYNEEYFYRMLTGFLKSHPHLNHDSANTLGLKRSFLTTKKIGINNLLLAYSYFQDGMLDIANADVSKILKHKLFFNGRSHALMGKIKIAQGQFQEAKIHLNKALEQKPAKIIKEDIQWQLCRIDVKQEKYKEAHQKLVELLANSQNSSLLANCLHLKAQLNWINKKESAAQATWQHVCQDYWQEDVVSLAALYLMGQGPLIHGMEDLRSFHGKNKPNKIPAHTHYKQSISQINTAIKNAHAYLTEQQRSYGSWTDTHYIFMGAQHRRNTYYAITSLAAHALLQWQHISPIKTNEALDRADKFLLDRQNLGTTTTEKVFALAYGLDYLVFRQETAGLDYNKHIDRIIKRLAELQSPLANTKGAWGHEYYNPFTTATVLNALYHAKQAGFEVKENITQNAATVLKRFKGEDGSYPYGMGKRKASFPKAYPRSAFCEAARLQFDDFADQVDLKRGIEEFFKNKDNLNKVRQYDFHAGKYAEGGFFFYYDVYGISLAIQQLDSAKLRAKYSFEILNMIINNQEIDGSFVDSPNIGKSYGTAMALLTLKLIYDDVTNL